MLTAIMTSPDFAEVCFLIAVILCVISVVLTIANNVATWVPVLLTSAVGFLALGFLAL